MIKLYIEENFAGIWGLLSFFNRRSFEAGGLESGVQVGVPGVVVGIDDIAARADPAMFPFVGA